MDQNLPETPSSQPGQNLLKNKNNKIALGVLAALLLGAGLWWALAGGLKPTNQSAEQTNGSTLPWRQGQDGYEAVGTPPACPYPLTLQSPVDISKVTSILYPGQTRGGNYKPHGGFRFDSSTNNLVTVRVPMSGFAVQGSNYMEMGEVQYLFEFLTPCGIMFRFDHLRTLDPKFAELAKQFPAPTEGDSRTTVLSSPVAFSAGEVIATEVGFSKNGLNVSVDFGVYDLRSKNTASADSAWAAQHPGQLAQNGICWFDLLPSSDATIVKSLPAGDSTSAKTSDYCI